MNYFKKFISYITIIVIGLIMIAPISVQAATDASKEALCGGAGLVGGGSGCAAPSGSTSVDTVVKRSINLFSAIIGIIAVVMIMVGGLKYITSQGDPNATATAKNTILYAAIGLVVVALAQVIVRFVISRFVK